MFRMRNYTNHAGLHIPWPLTVFNSVLQVTSIGQALGLGLLLWTFDKDSNLDQNSITLLFVAFGMFIYGLNLGVGSVVDATLLQKLVPEDKPGTVFSVFSSLRYTGVPVGLFFRGILLEHDNAIILFGAFIALLLICSLLWLRGALQV